jgi:hypothetical protein
MLVLLPSYESKCLFSLKIMNCSIMWITNFKNKNSFQLCPQNAQNIKSVSFILCACYAFTLIISHHRFQKSSYQTFNFTNTNIYFCTFIA